MIKVTEQTTLAELAAALVELGNPFVTIMRSHPGDAHARHAIAYLAGVGSFPGSGATEAEALDAALTALRLRSVEVKLIEAAKQQDPKFPPGWDNDLRRPLDDEPRCQAKGQCADLDGSGSCKGCGRWLGGDPPCHGCSHMIGDHPNDSGCQHWHAGPS